MGAACSRNIGASPPHRYGRCQPCSRCGSVPFSADLPKNSKKLRNVKNLICANLVKQQNTRTLGFGWPGVTTEQTANPACVAGVRLRHGNALCIMRQRAASRVVLRMGLALAAHLKRHRACAETRWHGTKRGTRATSLPKPPGSNTGEPIHAGARFSC